MKKYKGLLEKKQLKILTENTLLDIGLDLAGLIPAVGEGFDAINAVRYIKKAKDAPKDDTLEKVMNLFYAGMSLLSLVPAAGDLVGKSAKWLAKIGSKGVKSSPKILSTIGKLASKAAPALTKVSGALKNAPIDKIKELAPKIENYLPDIAQAFDSLKSIGDKGTQEIPQHQDKGTSGTQETPQQQDKGTSGTQATPQQQERGTLRRYKSLIEKTEFELGGIEKLDSMVKIDNAPVVYNGKKFKRAGELPPDVRKTLFNSLNKQNIKGEINKVTQDLDTNHYDIVIDGGIIYINDEKGNVLAKEKA